MAKRKTRWMFPERLFDELDGISIPGEDTYGNAASFLKRTRLSVYRIAVTPSGQTERSE
jgi:hypothetical protein